MSILPIPTSFRNISVGPYVLNEFWVNDKGFTSTTSGSTVTLPGLYGSGCSILSCDLIAPGVGLQGALGSATVVLTAKNNLATPLTLYSQLSTGSAIPGTGLGSSLPADSWLELSSTGGNAVPTGQAIGLVVQYTTLTQTQPR